MDKLPFPFAWMPATPMDDLRTAPAPSPVARRAVGPKEGVVRARVDGGSAPAALYDVTRGNLTYVFELCGVQGTVDPPDGSGAEVRYRVRWT